MYLERAHAHRSIPYERVNYSNKGGHSPEWQWGPSADIHPGGRRLLRVQGDAEDLVGVRVRVRWG